MDSDSIDVISGEATLRDQASAKFRVDGQLFLNFRTKDDPSKSASPSASLDAKRLQTIVDVNRQKPPLRIIRSFPMADGAALVHLHNVSGGVLGGDRLRVRLDVDPHAQAQVTTTGATRLYKHRMGYPDAEQTLEIHVGEGGLLEYIPDTLIPFAGARYRQHTRIRLAQDAGLFMWELVAPGRDARGERFAYERLDLQLDIQGVGLPLALERFCLEPAVRALTSPVRLAEYRYFATLYMCRVGVSPDRWTRLEEEINGYATRLCAQSDVLWGASTLTAHGLVIRGLGHTSHALAPSMVAFWQMGKQALYRRPAILPRKML